MPDEKQVMTRFWLCANCFCHVPQTAIDERVRMNQALQIAYHENRWQESTAEEMQKLLDDLKFMLHHLRPHFGTPGPNHSVIELGCGRGGLLKALIDAGYDASGCEPGAAMVAQARRCYELDEHRLACMSATDFLDAVEARGQRPNVIVLWHVVEHIRSPMALIERCVRLLGADGRLILQLPMLNPPDIFPEHYFFFTTHTVRHLSRQLGNLPYYFTLDLHNMYLSVFLGEIYRHIQPTTDVNLDAEQHFSRALSEPINLRQQRIAELRALLEASTPRAAEPAPTPEAENPPTRASAARRLWQLFAGRES